MKYAMLIYQTPEAFEARKNGDDDPSVGAWRAYYRALVDSGAYVGGDPLHVPETATTVRLKDGRRHIQDGPYANTKEQLAGFAILELPSLDAALESAEAERIFKALSENGTVTMPLQQTFWAVRFGMLVDRFGIPWMVNCEGPR